MLFNFVIYALLLVGMAVQIARVCFGGDNYLGTYGKLGREEREAYSLRRVKLIFSLFHIQFYIGLLFVYADQGLKSLVPWGLVQIAATLSLYFFRWPFDLLCRR